MATTLQREHFADKAREKATEEKLGKRTAHFRYRQTAKATRISVLVILAGSTLLMAWLTVFFISSFSTFLGEIPTGENLATYNQGGGIVLLVLLILIGLLALGLSAVTLWVARNFLHVMRSGGPPEIFLFEEGVVLINTQTSDQFRWSDVASVWQTITSYYAQGVVRTTTTYHYELRLSDGRTYAFNNSIAEIALLGQKIAQEVLRRQLPRDLAAYNAGETVLFGKLAINQQGVKMAERSLPWKQFQSMTLAKGQLQIKATGRLLTWASIAVSEVPNVFVLLALVKALPKG